MTFQLVSVGRDGATCSHVVGTTSSTGVVIAVLVGLGRTVTMVKWCTLLGSRTGGTCVRHVIAAEDLFIFILSRDRRRLGNVYGARLQLT